MFDYLVKLALKNVGIFELFGFSDKDLVKFEELNKYNIKDSSIFEGLNKYIDF